MSNGCANDALVHLRDSARDLARGAAGVALILSQSNERQQWLEDVVLRLYKVFEHRAADVTVAWLRPTEEEPELLTLFIGENVPEEVRYDFRLGQALAGKAWERGGSAVHSPDEPHEDYVIRKGCSNAVYLCATIGAPGGAGGLLGVGSDTGFAVHSGDLLVVETYAALLATVIATTDETRALQRAKALRAELMRGADRKSLEPAEEQELRDVLAALRLSDREEVTRHVPSRPPTTVGQAKSELDSLLQVLKGR